MCCCIVQWLLEVRLFERVLGAIDVRESEWVHANAAQVACEVLRIVRENAALLLSDRNAGANANAMGMGMGLGPGGLGLGFSASSSPLSGAAGANNAATLAKLEQLLDHVHSYAPAPILDLSSPLLI